MGTDSLEARPPAITTARLRLVALVPAEIAALMTGDTVEAGELAGVTFPTGWPEPDEVRSGLGWHLSCLHADPTQTAWRIRAIVERDTGTVVGSTNLKGPPDHLGDVEIGWGVDVDRRRRGYAFEAVKGLMEWVASHHEVRSVSATVSDENLASQHLASRLGMTRSDVSRRGLPLWVRPLNTDSVSPTA